eukprot:TRINITY_DN27216_c0_g1_i1.p2 TRINITY_DN27216_c0_g1~~TRINITY_DN27216_c0_g1_i1.p2  ORF type:complete len:283 (+),score=78.52 TRINITY_DN27216_c0_g1_i1:42-890(+)
MQHDDTIWSVISQGFCSFKAKLRDDVGHAGAKTEALCRNPYNATGICNRVNCPLANSQYATVIEKDNELYLFMKTVERAHTPKRLWEKILLPGNFKKALEIINENMQWWDRKVVMKCKHRLLRLKQVLIRKRRLALKGVPKLVGIKKKEEKQLNKREAKAEIAARIPQHIRNTLLSVRKDHQLPEGVTEEEMLRIVEAEEERGDDAIDEAEEFDSDDLTDVDFTEDESSDEESEEGSMEGEVSTVGSKRSRSSQKPAKRMRIEIEAETEMQNRLSSKSIMDW